MVEIGARLKNDPPATIRNKKRGGGGSPTPHQRRHKLQEPRQRRHDYIDGSSFIMDNKSTSSPSNYQSLNFAKRFAKIYSRQKDVLVDAT